MVDDTPRLCATCGEFYTPHREAARNSTYCGSKCREKARRLRDPEKKREKDRVYNARNSEAHVARARAWAKANPERMREHQRRSTLKRKFGLTLEEYDTMLREQDDRCAICGTTDTSPWRWLTVDHDHETGAIRALLCQRCNSCLGQAGDDPARLRAAADYLERFK